MNPPLTRGRQEVVLGSGLTHGRCSPIQERWYRLRAAHPAASAFPPFRFTQDLTLTGAIDPALLAASLSATVRRHWGLRSAFRVDGDHIWQTVREPCAAQDLQIHDLRRVRAADDRLLEIVRDLYVRPLEVANGTVFQAGLILLEDDRHRLLISMDHLVRDARSDAIVVRDLFTIYRALCANPAQDPDEILGSLRHQYVDWADQQWRLLASGFDVELRDYWTRRLAGATEALLPADDEAPEHIGLAFACRESLTTEPFANLSGLVHGRRPQSRREHVTACVSVRPLALLTSLFAMLHQITGQRDLCVVVPTEARTRGVLPVVGYFVLPLIIRVEVGDGISFRDLFRRVLDAYRDAQEWSRVPLYAVFQPPRGLLRVAFNYQRRAPMRWKGLHVEGTAQRYSTSFYTDLDLIFVMSERPDALDVNLISRKRRFRPETAHGLIRNFVGLAAELLASPDRQVG